MKKIINAIPDIVTEMLDGVVAAHPETLRRLEGQSVIVRKEIRADKVTLVSGGGSGHEPAHAGYVGTGMLDAAVAAGAPEGIISWIDQPSLELSNLVMKECDCILATGGPGMVHSAYSSGKPALGVGAGNVPAIIDTSADASGIASKAVITDGSDTVVVSGLTVTATGAGGDVQFDNVNFAAGQTVLITAGAITHA